MSLWPLLIIAAAAEYSDRYSERFVHYEKPAQDEDDKRAKLEAAEAKRLRKQQKRLAK